MICASTWCATGPFFKQFKTQWYPKCWLGMIGKGQLNSWFTLLNLFMIIWVRETIVPCVKNPFSSRLWRIFHVCCDLMCMCWGFLDAAVDNYSSLQSLQEAAFIGVDSLGFDLKVCSGTQVQTLQFAFHTRVWQLSFS